MKMKKSLVLIITGLFILSGSLFSQTECVVELSTITNVSPAYGIGTKGNYLYANPGFSYIEIFNISDPETPYSAGTVNYSHTFATQLDIYNDYLYIYGGPENNFIIFDISDPSSPEELGYLQLYGGSYAAHLSDYSYITSGNNIYIINTSDKSAPFLENTVSYSGGSSQLSEIYASSEILYIGTDLGVLIYDNTNPSLPVFNSLYPNGRLSLSVDSINEILYTSQDWGSDHTHYISDISDPFNPVLLSEGSGGSSAIGSLIYNNGMLVQGGVNTGGSQGVSFYKIQDNTSVFLEDFQGSISYEITDMAVIDSVFIIAKYGGIEFLKLATCPNQETAIPDPIFEQALIDLGYDTGTPDGYVPTENINTVTELSVIDIGISDLTGIQDFTNLRKLMCYYNYLTSLDVSQNLLLTHLYFYNNQVSSIDVSNNSYLEVLSCESNHLTNVNVLGATNLETISCSDNNLNHLDVSGNTQLITLACGNNDLTSLLLTYNSHLEHLYAKNNFITSLDISNNSFLERLWCNNNQLSILNVQNGINSSFTEFHATGNPNLWCIQVDNVEWAENNWSEFVDPTANFSADCTVGIDKKNNSIFVIKPNPANDYIHIQTSSVFTTSKQLSVTITNSIGINIEEFPLKQVSISKDISHYPAGLYFFVIRENGVVLETHKIQIN